MGVLALDIATSTGWAYHTEGMVMHGTWDLSVRRGHHTRKRLHRLWVRLEGLHRIDPIHFVIYEEAGGLRGPGQKVLPQLHGVLELWCHMNGINTALVNVSDIKKHATGSGRADKEAMIKAAVKRWPDRKFSTHDEVDAMWLLDYAQKQYGQGLEI